MDPNIRLLNIHGLYGNLCMEGHAFLMAINEMCVCMSCETVCYLKSNDCLGKVMEYTVTMVAPSVSSLPDPPVIPYLTCAFLYCMLH
jgi:hypothetical protein